MHHIETINKGMKMDMNEYLNEIADLVFNGEPKKADELYSQYYRSLDHSDRISCCQMIGKIKRERLERYLSEVKQ